MKAAYVDTSALLAVALRQPGHAAQLEKLVACDRLFASNLLEAEFRSALVREAVSEPSEHLLDWVSWVLPKRALEREFGRVLKAGFLRGADLWHLACALYFRQIVPALAFLSADRRQLEVAGRLGFDLVG